MKLYILDENNNPIKEPDTLKWSDWFQTAKRHVADDYIEGYRVSTIFLGMDHSWNDPSPLLWETMVFPEGDWGEEYCDRYSTYGEALAGHAKAIEWVKKGKIE